jgi:hypothetical protein
MFAPTLTQRLLLLGTAAVLALGCNESRDVYGDINVSSKLDAADGLDLKAVGELVKSVENAEQLEKKLNEPGSVNNLDLNEDGKVDFVHVTEYGNDQAKGFSLTVEPAKGETQEIATIEVEKKGEAAEVDLRGNEQIYGQHHHYHYGVSPGSFLLMAYLFRPHPFYMSPFHFGYYPPYYGLGYGRVGHAAYQRRTRTITKGSTAQRVSTARPSTIASPNKGKSASKGIKNSLRNPTKSQKAFRATARKPPSTRGFGQRMNNRGTSQRARPARRASGGGFRSRGFRSGGFRSRR